MSRRTLPVDVGAAVDVEAAIDHLMRFLSIDGISGQEGAIAAAVTDALKAAGLPASDIRFDDAPRRIPMPTETGNLLVRLPGTNPGPRLAFATHLDTVPLCAGAKPTREDGRVVSDGSTALGGDNRAGCVDGASAAQMITGAVGGETWDVGIHGKAAHAGVAPEKGISATLAASIAIADAHRGGWFGKVITPSGTGTSNVGVFGGRGDRSAGDATNVVTDYVHIAGESRSDDPSFTSAITRAYSDAFANAAARVTDDAGASAEVRFEGRVDYYPFRLADDAPVVVHATRAAVSIGLTPTTIFSHGGLDANWFARHGLPTITIGAGQGEIHTVKEFVDLAEFANGCRLAVALATLEA